MVYSNSDNLFGLSPYIVDLNNAAYYPTIQSAINQAVTDGHSTANPTVVYVRCGTYVENVSLVGGIFVIGVCNEEPFAPQAIISGSVTATENGGDLFFIENLSISATVGNALILTGVAPMRFLARNLQISSTDPAGWGIDYNCNSGTFGLVLIEDCDVFGNDYAVNVVNHNSFASFRGSYRSNSLVLSAINISDTSRYVAKNDTLTNTAASLILNGSSSCQVDYSQFAGAVYCNDTTSGIINYTSITSGTIEGITIALGATCRSIVNIIDSNAASGFWVTGTGTIATGGNNTLTGTATLIDPGTTITGFGSG